jgi:hypothetical protein
MKEFVDCSPTEMIMRIAFMLPEANFEDNMDETLFHGVEY